METFEGRAAFDGYQAVLKQIRDLLDSVDGYARPVGTTRMTWALRHHQEDRGLTVLLEPWGLPKGRDERQVAATTTAVVRGVESLAIRAEIPEYYSEVALDHVQRAGGRPAGDGIRGLQLTAVNGRIGPSAEVTAQVVDNAKTSMTPETRSRGSVEGVLDVLNLRGKRPRAGLLEARTRRAVTIVFRAEQQTMFTAAINQRVAVAGMVHRNRNGQPVRVDAEELVVMPGRLEAGGLARLIGIAPGWTGGLSSEEFVEHARRGA